VQVRRRSESRAPTIEIDPVRAAVAIQNDGEPQSRSRAERPAQAQSGRAQPGAGAIDRRAERNREGPLRTQGGRQVEQAPAIDGIGTGRAEVGRRIEQELDHLPGAAEGRRLEEQGHRTGDVGRRERGAADQGGVAVQRRRQDVDAGCEQKVLTGAAGAVAEIGDVAVGIERADRDRATAGRRGAGEDRREDRVGAAVVAGSQHQDALRFDRALERIAQDAIERAGAAHAVVEHPRAMIDRVVGGVGQVRLVECASAGARTRRVRAHHQQVGIECHAVHQSGVAPRGDDAGDRSAMTVDIPERRCAAGHDVDAVVVDRAGEFRVVEIDAGVDHAHPDAITGRPGGIRRRRPDHLETAVGEIFGGLVEGPRVGGPRSGARTATAAAAGCQENEDQQRQAAPPSGLGP
jgi:hypothetical protein